MHGHPSDILGPLGIAKDEGPGCGPATVVEGGPVGARRGWRAAAVLNADIPSGGILTVVFTAKTSSATPLGKVSNTVNVTYKNSAGGAIQTAVVNNGSATVDDVTVKATPPQPTLAL